MNTYYDNYGQASSAMGWPVRKFKIAKKLGADGFKGNRVRPTQLLAWYDVPENQKKLDSAYEQKSSTINDNRTIEEVKLSLAIKDEKLKELQIREKEGEYITPDEIAEFLLKLRLTFESIVKGWIIEIPPKIVGLTQPEIEFKLNQEVSLLLNNFAGQIKSKMEEQRKQSGW